MPETCDLFYMKYLGEFYPWKCFQEEKFPCSPEPSEIRRRMWISTNVTHKQNSFFLFPSSQRHKKEYLQIYKLLLRDVQTPEWNQTIKWTKARNFEIEKSMIVLGENHN